MQAPLRTDEVIDGRFRLDRKLGQGAFGEVWQCRDLTDERDCAVKFLFEKFREDKKVMQRFVQEAKLLVRLQHPVIARAYHYSTEGDRLYLAMDLIEGESLDKRCEAHSAEGKHVPKAGVAWMADQLCAAVQHAHDEAVIHRDLKPRNVMVNSPGERPFVKVLDFGIAKVLVGSEVDPTTLGRVLGSALYIAPEQILNRPADHRSDLFSVGTILYEMLSLRRAWARTDDGEPLPFHEPVKVGKVNNQITVLQRITRDPRPSVTAYRPDIAPAVDEVLQRALAIEPGHRFHSATELARALRIALMEERVPPRIVPAATTRSERPPPMVAPAEPQVGTATLDTGPPADLLGDVDPEAEVPTVVPRPDQIDEDALETPKIAPPSKSEAEEVLADPLLDTAATEGPAPSVVPAPPPPVPPKAAMWPWVLLGLAVAAGTFAYLAFGVPG